MKKISLLSLAFASAFAASAQNIGDPDKAHKPLRTDMSVQTRFGLRAGVNLASLELDDDNSATNYNTNSKTSFHAGAFVNIPIGGMFRLQPEVSYLGAGSKVRGNWISNPLNQGNYELDYHYLTVPVMLQLQTNSGFFLEAGPQVGFLLKAEEDRGEGGESDVKDMVRTTDFGAAAGIGYLSRIGLGINARYLHGFSNVYNNDEAPAGVKDAEISNRGVNIGLVYHFGAAK